MRTDITTIDSNGNGVQLALNRIEGLADVGMLARKDRLHLRLLAEETFSMVTAIVGEFSAKFWAESGEDEYRIILQGDADITEEEEAQLLSVSSSGENTASKGIMARIWKHYKAALKENRKAAVMEAARGMTYSEAELLYGKLGTIRFDPKLYEAVEEQIIGRLEDTFPEQVIIDADWARQVYKPGAMFLRMI